MLHLLISECDWKSVTIDMVNKATDLYDDWGQKAFQNCLIVNY